MIVIVYPKNGSSVVVAWLSLRTAHYKASLFKPSVNVLRDMFKEASKAAAPCTRGRLHLAIAALITFHADRAPDSTVAPEYHFGAARVTGGVDSGLDFDDVHVFLHSVELHKHRLYLNVVILTHVAQICLEFIYLSVLMLLTFNEYDGVVERLVF